MKITGTEKNNTHNMRNISKQQDLDEVMSHSMSHFYTSFQGVQKYDTGLKWVKREYNIKTDTSQR